MDVLIWRILSRFDPSDITYRGFVRIFARDKLEMSKYFIGYDIRNIVNEAGYIFILRFRLISAEALSVLNSI